MNRPPPGGATRNGPSRHVTRSGGGPAAFTPRSSPIAGRPRPPLSPVNRARRLTPATPATLATRPRPRAVLDYFCNVCITDQTSWSDRS